jgi:trehalose 6-phosphate synthase/phosphatase
MWANKGCLPERLAPFCPGPDFILAMGDDRTDEDLFERLPESAWTVKVGRGETRARFTLADPAAARQALARLPARAG